MIQYLQALGIMILTLIASAIAVFLTGLIVNMIKGFIGGNENDNRK